MVKIRTDFVTNSSSTAFCIVGVPLKKLTLPTEASKEDFDMGEFCAQNDLQVDFVGNAAMDMEEDLSVGVPISKLKDDETLWQLKTKALKVLRKAFPGSKLSVQDIKLINGEAEF